MPPSLKANVNPAMLAWARDDSGHTLDMAADRTGYTVERLEGWEQGAEISIPQLRKLALVYRRPLSLFFMPSPPPGFEPMRDFRRMPDADDPQWSPALRALIRRARAQQRIYNDLLHDLGEELPGLPMAPNPDDPEAVGVFAREVLGVGLETQQSWRDAGTAIRGWTRAIEENGILALYTSTTRGHSVSTEEMLGFSDADPVPVIVLNGSDNVRRRTFTLLHEFAHLLVRRAGVCDLHDRYTTGDYDPTEVFCNAAAAAALMPRNAFLADPDVRAGRNTTDWGDTDLGYIARRFTTSREAVLRRMLTLGLTTEQFYRSWRDRYYTEFEEPATDTPKSTGGPSYYTMKVRELGVPYISTVLDAYNRDAINASDLARFLNIKLKSLPGVEEEVVKNEARAS